MEIDEDTVERLARAIHSNYLAEFAPDGESWEHLDEDLKEANRAQARDIGAKLDRIGADVSVTTAGNGVTTFTFSDEELETLARAEHERWVAQRTEAGWHTGDRNDTAKLHPSLVPWEQLSDSEQDKDRDAVRHIPDVLAEVGLRVVRP
jgi:RyR domain